MKVEGTYLPGRKSNFLSFQIDSNEKEVMNSNSDTTTLMIETVDDESTSIDDDMHEINYNQRPRTHITRSSAGSTSSNGTTTTTTPTTTHHGIKRQKEISPCFVCGARAHGYNFDQSNKKKNKGICRLLFIYFIFSHV
jgi:hypothetical protein